MNGDDFYFQEPKCKWLERRLIEIFKRETPPECRQYLKLLHTVNDILENEEGKFRPRDRNGLPGGILYLKEDLPTIIVPDIHARIDFFLGLMLWEDEEGFSNLQKMESDMLQIVCLGDGFHAEGRAVQRWALAYEEYTNKYKKHRYMDEEMRESLGVMEMVKEVKSAFPLNFHFLKGNHENIANELGEGNYPFRKYSYEGSMVLYYVEKFYGEEFLRTYYTFEKNLPIMAVGKNFLVSHAEDEAEDGSVERMLSYYLPEEVRETSYYFGGHRPVSGFYNLRAEGKYVQIHNPNKSIIASIKLNKDIDLDEDIVEIEFNTDKIVNRSNVGF
jgi:hypothetical protein